MAEKKKIPPPQPHVEDISGNEAQMAASSFKLAALDDEFLLSEDMRGVRFMLEFAKADLILRRWGIVSTIVVFGSARIHESGAGRQAFWYGEARRFGKI